MSALDFLKFKEFDYAVDMELNGRGSGTWEVAISQGDSQMIVLTLDQLNKIRDRCIRYAEQPAQK